MEWFLKYFLLFMIYSFVGWCIEIISIFHEDKKLVNRGFLLGPYCPIYGFGGVLLTTLLQKYQNDLITLFVLSVIICALLEYFVSWFLEVVFKLRWWDYSKRKFNINGRICLETMIPFGIVGVLFVKVFNPFLLNIINKASIEALSIIDIVLLTVIIVDCIISFNLIIDFKNITKQIKKDSTEDIRKYIKKSVKSDAFLYTRLINSFPKLQKIYQKNKHKKGKKKKTNK